MIIDLRDVTVRRAGRAILGPMDWQVRAGERWVVLGPNGSGKTTLCSVAAMDLWPTSGTVDVLGERYGKVDARAHRKRIGSAGSAIEARFRADLTPRTLIMTARHGAFEPWWHRYEPEDAERAGELARRLRLAGQVDQPFETLSAGERRRTSIARALMADPDLLLLDEPTAGLDLAARETILADLARLALHDRPRAIVLVSHHLEEIPRGFDHALVLRDGRVVAGGPIGDVLVDAVVSDAFGLPMTIRSADGRWSAVGRGDAEPSSGPAMIGS